MSIIKNKSNGLLILGFSVLISGVLNASVKVDNNTTVTEQKTVFTEIVATVNGENIYKSQLDKLIKKELRNDSILKSSGTNSAQESVLRHTILNKLIEKEILKQASLKEPILDIDKKIKEDIATIKEKYGSIEKYKSYLQDMSDEEFNTLLKNKVQMKEYLKKQGVVNPDIPEEEIKKFYGDGTGSFKVEELIKAKQILLLFKADINEDEKNKIKEKAEKLREQIANGADFSKLAKEHSQSGEANATVAGDLGIVKKGYMPKEFDEVAFAMKKGELSKVFASKFGYHIVKVTDRREAGVTPYEDVKDFIRKFLQEKETVKMLDALKKRLKSEAKVEIMLDKK